MHEYINRFIEDELADCLASFPAVAVLGPRQCGKTTLARHVIGRHGNSLYLDLEKPSDARKLTEPEIFLNLHHDKLVCLDEIQRLPNLFPVLRSIIDSRSQRPGQFLILGSASPDLIRQSGETLAGRIAYLELTPFLFHELQKSDEALEKLWVRGGFPGSFLAKNGADSVRWRRNFIRSFLERDVPMLASRLPSPTIKHLWKMCAHLHGQLLNLSALGSSLGISHTTVRSYLDLLSETFMLRIQQPFLPNLRKRLVKSPRIYVRDSGILHQLLEIESADDLMGHPVRGASWEGFVIENVLAACCGWRGYFYRTVQGAEIDLVLEKGVQRIAIECKASSAPDVTPGFWNALEDIKPTETWILAPVAEQYPFRNDVKVAPLHCFMEAVQNR